ncbi:hypothetical protein TNCV_4474361 [Trichonephila clavipes]|nr:hypothetical protein TNCV_4474361 [Trichonephila clavipes]
MHISQKNQYPEQPPRAVIKALIRLDIQSNRDWMTCTCTDAHTASTQCHRSSTVVIGVWWRASHSATMDHVFSTGERSGERVCQGQQLSIFRIKEDPGDAVKENGTPDHNSWLRACEISDSPKTCLFQSNDTTSFKLGQLLVMRDEAHFWTNGYVNKQNCRIWSEANPQVYAETPLHPEKLTVWCALWAGGILLQKR